MHGLVLSLFPGADLLGRAFEARGWCVVRGPDVLWGGDVRDFHAPPGRFDVVIGGPPCQVYSALTQGRTKAVDMIPDFMRVVEEAQPRAAVMENVTRARGEIPGWQRSILRDFDCGGLTNRRRAFWTRGLPLLLAPSRRVGVALPTVLATSWKPGGNGAKLPDGSRQWPKEVLSVEQASHRQGYPDLGAKIAGSQPVGISNTGRTCLAVHMLGNGVPKAMADYVAAHVTKSLCG